MKIRVIRDLHSLLSFRRAAALFKRNTKIFEFRRQIKTCQYHVYVNICDVRKQRNPLGNGKTTTAYFELLFDVTFLPSSV